MNVARLLALVAATCAAAALAAAAIAATKGHAERFAPTAADQRLAASVTLHRADLEGGHFSLSRRPLKQGDSACASYDPDLSRFTITGHADSVFTAPGQFVQSSVELFRTRGDAAGDFDLNSTRQGWSCLKAGVADVLRKEFAAVATPRWKVTRFGPRMYNASGIFTVKTSAGWVPFAFSFAARQTGRGTITLGFLFPAEKPIPGAAALASKLRLRANRL